MVNTDPWPFDQSRSCAVFVTQAVFAGKEPILHVTHDSDDHGWQFAGPTYNVPENARVLALAEVVRTDSSLLELSKLPVGGTLGDMQLKILGFANLSMISPQPSN